MSKVDLITYGDWSYTRALREGDLTGGLVLQDVRHQQYLLAKDLRITRVWVGSKTAAKPIVQDYMLGSPGLPLKSATGIAPLPGEEALIAPFKTPLHESAIFETARSALGSGTDTPKLTVQQDYLFTNYGKNPPHEPAGIVDAVRIYPLLTFNLPASSAKTRPVDYVRVDYRLALTVEQFEGDTTNVKKGTEFQDQIGVFRDAETLSFPYAITDIFEAGEKPVTYEILGRGIDRGKKSQWDNIHQWAAGKIPETPGASHANHLHWRWGTPATQKTYAFPPKTAAGPQFAGVGGKAGAPQIDPRIPDQSLTFAITAFDPQGQNPAVWDADNNGSTANFEDLFFRGRPTPLKIDKGTGLVIWISVETWRKPSTDPWQGTFFMHGIFFAHELISSSSFVLSLTGINQPFYKNTVNDQKWWRPKRPSDLP